MKNKNLVNLVKDLQFEYLCNKKIINNLPLAVA